MAAENTCYGNVPGVFSRSDSMLSISINTLWIVGLFLKGALLIVLTVSKVWRRFPIFTAYASSNFVFGVALYVVHAMSKSNNAYFSVYWISQAMGLVLGLGLYAIVQLVSVAARSQFGRETASHTFAVVGMVAFNSSLLIWLGYLLAPELAASRNELPRKAVLEQWNQALMELIQR